MSHLSSPASDSLMVCWWQCGWLSVFTQMDGDGGKQIFFVHSVFCDILICCNPQSAATYLRICGAQSGDNMFL